MSDEMHRQGDGYPIKATHRVFVFNGPEKDRHAFTLSATAGMWTLQNRKEDWAAVLMNAAEGLILTVPRNLPLTELQVTHELNVRHVLDTHLYDPRREPFSPHQIRAAAGILRDAMARFAREGAQLPASLQLPNQLGYADVHADLEVNLSMVGDSPAAPNSRTWVTVETRVPASPSVAHFEQFMTKVRTEAATIWRQSSGRLREFRVDGYSSGYQAIFKQTQPEAPWSPAKQANALRQLDGYLYHIRCLVRMH